MGIASKERIGRLEEGIVLLRRLFTEAQVIHHGRFYDTDGVTVEPKPVQKPLPIWIASNPTTVTYKVGQAIDARNVERAFRRVAHLADGWMTNKIAPRVFAEQWNTIRGMAAEEGRDPGALGNVLYHNININPDRKHALEESTRFLNAYYTANFTPAFVEAWTAMGTPAQCIEQLHAYFEAGVQEIAVRLTSWQQRRQLELFLNEVAPAFAVNSSLTP
jgi:alkanesulfonate monooxygenase SsuD/methylene tetrahydromethanopterin reductase-like flavin-dependent oxidoreductase (luciferase family)